MALFAEALTGRTLLPVSNYKAEWTYNVERNYQHVSRVPTGWQRALGTAPLVAAHRPTSLLLCQGVRAPSSMPYALAWCLLFSEGMCAPGLSRSCKAPVCTAHAHHPRGEGDAHCSVREKR